MKNLKTLAIGTGIGIAAFLGAKNINANHENKPISVRIASVDNSEPKVDDTDLAENKIQVALLLDTSNSMDGLIDQAKSRLWNIVNTLTTLKYNGKPAQIEIALYEYGNDGISDENFIRQVTPLTQDLDLISEKLFALKTNGGQEYCGAVIRDASKNLNWDNNSKSMKLIYIAGNEPFNQGKIEFKEVVMNAKKNNIYTNTIFCGNREEGIRTDWQKGAELGEGKYFNIDSNKKVIYIETPYDVRISDYNSKLNDTYITYGSIGYEYKEKQIREDANAYSKSASNAVERTVAKSKKNAYSNQHWDLVDKAEKDKDYLQKIKDEELPKELKGKSKAEIKKIVDQKTIERAKIQKEIEQLSKQRQQYIDAEMQKSGKSDGDDLGKAMEKSIVEIAKKNGYGL